MVWVAVNDILAFGVCSIPTLMLLLQVCGAKTPKKKQKKKTKKKQQ